MYVQRHGDILSLQPQALITTPGFYHTQLVMAFLIILSPCDSLARVNELIHRPNSVQ